MASISAPPAAGKRAPTDYLKALVGRPVVVKLNNGTVFRGILATLDGYLNLALEQTEEYIGENYQQLKQRYGDSFIRGNNVLYIAAAGATGGGSKRVKV